MGKKKLRKKVYKKGDSMRIPGVLDYTGAKYPRKGQNGLITFYDPHLGENYYMEENAPFDAEGYRTSYTDKNRNNPGKTVIGLPNINVSGKKGNLKSRLYNVGHTQDVDWLINNSEAINIARGLNDLQLKEALELYHPYYNRFNTPKYNEGIYDKDTQDFIEKDIISRIRKYNPQISEESIQKLINAQKEGKVTYGDYEEFTGDQSGYDGFANIKDKYVKLNPFTEPKRGRSDTLVHELLHYLRQGYNSNLGKGRGYTEEEINKLNAAYNLSGFKYPNGELISEEEEAIEKGASNTQLRKFLKTIYNIPYTKTHFVEDLPEGAIERGLKYLNGYTNYMYNTNQYNIKALKRALEEVAMNDNNTNDKNLIAKNGAKIHIKKENRGKFTEYCGGKVTQECINRAKRSGNKTLVKRATFADNARHFKHRFGGQII